MVTGLFLDDVTKQLDSLVSRITSAIDNYLCSAQPGVPLGIGRQSILESLRGDGSDLLEISIPDRIFAVVFAAKAPSKRYYSPWLHSAILEAERQYRCKIYIRLKGTYGIMNQFDPVEQTVSMVALGDDPRSALLSVISKEQQFTPDLFDEDGYTKT